MENLTFNITGQTINAQFNPDKKEALWLPLLQYWKQLYQQKGSRIIIFLAAPPGAGKSTLAAYLHYLSTDIKNYPVFQVLPMDGFHHTNVYLSGHTTMRNGQTIALNSIKGAPETFDVDDLLAHTKSLKSDHPLPWPIYDRTIHDPINDAIPINSQIILIEGNYLLLDQFPWSTLFTFADDTLFITADCDQLKTRLINRKAKSTHYRKAVEFYEFSDAYNVTTVLNHSKKARLTLKLQSDNDYTVVEPKDDVVES